mgnify:FL=1
MSVRVFETASEEETIALGRQLARRLKPPAVVLLIGGLGAGKTTLAKGILSGLGVASPEEVTSPTFTLIHEFGGANKAYHIDLYRIESAAEALALGLDDLLAEEAVLLVEWGERFHRLWPRDRIEIRLERLHGARRITVARKD